jgi:fermentation-respiration switch protein FrsA (DUF1100 family)
MARHIFLFVFMSLLISSCTKIRLTETDAFDIKRTISAEYFNETPYAIEKVTFQSGDNLQLNGWYITQKNSQGTVLYFGGNGFVMVTSFHIIKSIIDQKVNLFVFDYRGYGENKGMPTVVGLKEDGFAAYRFLTQNKQIDPQHLIIHGHSMGSFIAAFVVSKTPSAGLVLECPIIDAKDWTGRLLPWFVKPFVKFDIEPVLLENRNLEWLAMIESPRLIIAGEKDQITPPGMAEKLFEEAKSTNKHLVIIKDGGHNNLPQKQTYSHSLDTFYQQVLLGRVQQY